MKSLVQEQRLSALIKSSLNLMCKTSLAYDTEVEIKGLIGITLDKKDVFLVDVREIISSGDYDLSEEEEQEEYLFEEADDENEIQFPVEVIKSSTLSARKSRALKRGKHTVKDKDEPKKKKKNIAKSKFANGQTVGAATEKGLDYSLVKLEKPDYLDSSTGNCLIYLNFINGSNLILFWMLLFQRKLPIFLFLTFFVIKASVSEGQNLL